MSCVVVYYLQQQVATGCILLFIYDPSAVATEQCAF